MAFNFASGRNFIEMLALTVLASHAVACARLSDSIARTYKNEQSENKTRATY